MTIKKVYTEIFDLLNSNKNKKVNDLLPQIMEIVESKQQSKTFLMNDKKEATHVFCYYHKKWESVEHFGKKKHSSSGYNSMCKEGVNQWTKQQRLYKLGCESLMDEVINGTLAPSKIQEEKEKLEDKKSQIVPRKDKHGFTKEEDIK